MTNDRTLRVVLAALAQDIWMYCHAIMNTGESVFDSYSIHQRVEIYEWLQSCLQRYDHAFYKYEALDIRSDDIPYLKFDDKDEEEMKRTAESVLSFIEDQGIKFGFSPRRGELNEVTEAKEKLS